MWLLSDAILENIARDVERIHSRAEEIAKKIDRKWQELPSATSCSACGVDGSRGIERLSALVLYSVSAVSVGRDVKEMSEITTLKPHTNIEERIRLHMHTSEFRIGSFADEELILIDGSLRGAFVRPAAYVDDPSKLYEAYELENLVPDFIEVLEEHLEILGKDLAEGRAKRNYLLTREKIFMEMEEGYRKGEKRLEDLMIFFEYIEYLHSLNRLLDKNVVFVAKSFYTHEFDQEINDSAVLQSLALKQFGFEKSGYIAFKPQLRKTLPWFVKEFRENFKNLFRDVSSAFIRFEDYGDIYLIETPQKIDEELISKLLSLEVNGYPLPLLQAHKYAKIKRGELKKAIQSLFASLKPEFAPLLRSGRDVLEG